MLPPGSSCNELDQFHGSSSRTAQFPKTAPAPQEGPEGGASTDPAGPSNLREAGVVSVGKLCADRIDVGRRIDDAWGSWCLALESTHVVL